MDMHGCLLKYFGLDTQLFGVRFYVTQGQRRGFFHHVAQVTRKGQGRCLGGREAGLYKQYLTAHLRPGQTGHHTDVFVRFP